MTHSVFISAGHYPASPGADDGHGFSEHPEAVEWMNALAVELGAVSVLVPTGKLPAKIAFINSLVQDGDCAIEIHFNSAEDAQGIHVGAGSETLYCPGSNSGPVLAQAVQTELAKTFPPNRGIKPGWYRMDPRNGPDAFLTDTHCTAIIVEPDFIHRRGIIQSFREEGVRALARGISWWLAEGDRR